MNIQVKRLPIMAGAVLALLAGLYGGLMRLGWGLPSVPSVSAFHGALMVSGFLGTLICLERAAALKRAWAFIPPVLTGLGALILIFYVQGYEAGVFLMFAGSAGLLLVFAVLIFRDPALHTVTMALGAAAWCAGNALWLARWPISHAAYWWAGFLVLTIWGERLELARLRRLGPLAKILFAGATVLLLAGLVLSIFRFSPGVRLTGVGFLGLMLWLTRYDVAWWTVRMEGLTRYIALCLLAGYFWLGMAGVFALSWGGVVAGPHYGAILHAVFLGFVFSMIFGHTPTIFPAVLGIPVPFRKTAFYAQLLLLHGSVAIRLAGDLAGSFELRHWGGVLNVAAILFFLFNTARGLPRALARPDGRAEST
ncbi:MAG: hypothetical protein P8018_09505 [Acidobacteriota bacterium]